MILKLCTCSTLDDDDKLDAVSFEQCSPVLLVVVSVSEVPARSVQQSEVVSETIKVILDSGSGFNRSETQVKEKLKISQLQLDQFLLTSKNEVDFIRE